jgi:transposase
VKVERVPWAEGKEQATRRLKWFLAAWARRLSWREVSLIFGVSWECVFNSVKMAVCWGLRHRSLEGIEAIGVDEVEYQKGPKYLTLVYQIDAHGRRLLWIGRDRTKKTLGRFFRLLGRRRSAQLKYVFSDMWAPYLAVIARRASQSIQVLDRFHIAQLFSKALDKVRAAEARQLAQDGYEPVLKHMRWLLLKRKRTRRETVRLRELLQYNLKTVKAYLLAADFRRFWDYRSPWRVGYFFAEWIRRAKRTRLEPFQKLARTLERHAELIFNWFLVKDEIAAGAVEGLNVKVKLVMRRSFGFRRENCLKYALYHTLGHLPEPNFTHRFC